MNVAQINLVLFIAVWGRIKKDMNIELIINERLIIKIVFLFNASNIYRILITLSDKMSHQTELFGVLFFAITRILLVAWKELVIESITVNKTIKTIFR